MLSLRLLHRQPTRRLLHRLGTARPFTISAPTRFNPLVGLEGVIEEIQDNDSFKNKKLRVRKKDPKILIPTDADNFKSVDENVSISRDGKSVQKSSSSSGGNGSGSGNGNNNNNNNNNNNDNDKTNEEYEQYEEDPSAWERLASTLRKCLETAGITFASLAVLAGAGLSYHKFYKAHVIDKMSSAFDKGDDAFELTMHKRTTKREGDWIERPQQKIIDDIISGKLVGRYFLLTGEKGCGKSSMVLNSIKKVDSFNVAILDAHSDPEIFRIRLGKALNFEYHEDYIGSLFSIRGPRDTTALLDIERAFNKLEEVAVQRVKKHGRPLVLIINNTHLIKDDAEGVKLVELLQQKAEALSGAGLVTMIFNSDDYWLYERLKKLGTRLEVINVHDFNRQQAINALQISRARFFNERVDELVANQVYDLIGGRPQHLAEVAKHADLIQASHRVIDREKTWFLNQCGLLGASMDDDVNESGKFSASAMLLMKELVDMYNDAMINEEPSENHRLPELPLWRARQIMTRNDFIQLYDNLNIFTIDSSNSFVRADSVPMMRGFLEIASQPGFNELLEETMNRIDEIESLGRTREVVAKDLFLGNTYKIKKNDKDGEITVKLNMKHNQEDDDDDDDPIKIQPTTKTGERSFWKNRLSYQPPMKTNEEKSLDN